MKFLGTTANGVEIFDRDDSHLHFEGGLNLELLQEAIKKIEFKGNFGMFVVKFEHPVGYTTCVPVSREDNVVMVYRIGRFGQTPMVKGRNPEICNNITIIITKDKESDCCILVTAYIGSGNPPEPWDKHLYGAKKKAQSEKFWSTHALIYDEAQIDLERTTV